MFAEVLLVFFEPWVGLTCHWILLFFCLVQSVFNNDLELNDYILGLSLIPITRIMSISMPITKLPQLVWYPLIYLPLLAAAFVVIRVSGLKMKQVGLVIEGNLIKQVILGLLIGLVLGSAVGFIEYLILKPQPIISGLSFEQLWLPALVLLLTTGFVEELIFRGVLQTLSEPVMGKIGIIFNSALFAILHWGFLSILDVLYVFIVAVIFAVIVKKAKNIFAVTMAHGVANTILFAVAPFILG
jgi:uncharacterized protein